jgi:hypothetical protein
MSSTDPTGEQLWGLRALLALQALCAIFFLFVLIVVMYINFNLALPTPTCPDGIQLNMSAGIGKKCFEEQIGLYTPRWAPFGFNAALTGNILCALISVSMWIAGVVRKSSRLQHERLVTAQLIVFCVALALYATILDPPQWFEELLHRL